MRHCILGLVDLFALHLLRVRRRPNFLGREAFGAPLNAGARLHNLPLGQDRRGDWLSLRACHFSLLRWNHCCRWVLERFTLQIGVIWVLALRRGAHRRLALILRQVDVARVLLEAGIEVSTHIQVILPDSLGKIHLAGAVKGSLMVGSIKVHNTIGISLIMLIDMLTAIIVAVNADHSLLACIAVGVVQILLFATHTSVMGLSSSLSVHVTRFGFFVQYRLGVLATVVALAAT